MDNPYAPDPAVDRALWGGNTADRVMGGGPLYHALPTNPGWGPPSRAALAPTPSIGYDANSGLIFSGGRLFHLDSGQQLLDAQQSGMLDRQNDQLPPGFVSADPQFVKNRLAEMQQGRGVVNTLGEMVRSGWGALTHDAPASVAQGMAGLAPSGSEGEANLKQYAQNWQQHGAEALLPSAIMTGNIPGAPDRSSEMDLVGRGTVGSIAVQGARAAGNMAPYIPMGGVGGAIAGAAIGGTSSYQQNMDKALANEVPIDTARAASLGVGAINAAANAGLIHMGAGLAKTGGKLFGLGASTVPEAVTAATNPAWGADWAKGVGQQALSGGATMGAASAGSAAVNNAAGMPYEDPLQAGIQSGVGMAAAAPFMGLARIPAAMHAGQNRSMLGSALENKDQPVNMLKAAEIVRDRIAPDVGEEPAQKWYQSQADALGQYQVQQHDLAAQQPISQPGAAVPGAEHLFYDPNQQAVVPRQSQWERPWTGPEESPGITPATGEQHGFMGPPSSVQGELSLPSNLSMRLPAPAVPPRQVGTSEAMHREGQENQMWDQWQNPPPPLGRAPPPAGEATSQMFQSETTPVGGQHDLFPAGEIPPQPGKTPEALAPRLTKEGMIGPAEQVAKAKDVIPEEVSSKPAWMQKLWSLRDQMDNIRGGNPVERQRLFDSFRDAYDNIDQAFKRGNIRKSALKQLSDEYQQDLSKLLDETQPSAPRNLVRLYDLTNELNAHLKASAPTADRSGAGQAVLRGMEEVARPEVTTYDRKLFRGTKEEQAQRKSEQPGPYMSRANTSRLMLHELWKGGWITKDQFDAGMEHIHGNPHDFYKEHGEPYYATDILDNGLASRDLHLTRSEEGHEITANHVYDMAAEMVKNLHDYDVGAHKGAQKQKGEGSLLSPWEKPNATHAARWARRYLSSILHLAHLGDDAKAWKEVNAEEKLVSAPAVLAARRIARYYADHPKSLPPGLYEWAKTKANGMTAQDEKDLIAEDQELRGGNAYGDMDKLGRHAIKATYEAYQAKHPDSDFTSLKQFTAKLRDYAAMSDEDRKTTLADAYAEKGRFKAVKAAIDGVPEGQGALAAMEKMSDKLMGTIRTQRLKGMSDLPVPAQVRKVAETLGAMYRVFKAKYGADASIEAVLKNPQAEPAEKVKMAENASIGRDLDFLIQARQGDKISHMTREEMLARILGLHSQDEFNAWLGQPKNEEFKAMVENIRKQIKDWPTIKDIVKTHIADSESETERANALGLDPAEMRLRLEAPESQRGESLAGWKEDILARHRMGRERTAEEERAAPSQDEDVRRAEEMERKVRTPKELKAAQELMRRALATPEEIHSAGAELRHLRGESGTAGARLPKTLLEERIAQRKETGTEPPAPTASPKKFVAEIKARIGEGTTVTEKQIAERKRREGLAGLPEPRQFGKGVPKDYVPGKVAPVVEPHPVGMTEAEYADAVKRGVVKVLDNKGNATVVRPPKAQRAINKSKGVVEKLAAEKPVEVARKEEPHVETDFFGGRPNGDPIEDLQKYVGEKYPKIGDVRDLLYVDNGILKLKSKASRIELMSRAAKHEEGHEAALGVMGELARINDASRLNSENAAQAALAKMPLVSEAKPAEKPVVEEPKMPPKAAKAVAVSKAKEKANAVQVKSADEGSVQRGSRARNEVQGEGVGKRNAVDQKPATEGKQAKAEEKVNEPAPIEAKQAEKEGQKPAAPTGVVPYGSPKTMAEDGFIHVGKDGRYKMHTWEITNVFKEGTPKYEEMFARVRDRVSALNNDLPRLGSKADIASSDLKGKDDPAVEFALKNVKTIKDAIPDLLTIAENPAQREVLRAFKRLDLTSSLNSSHDVLVAKDGTLMVGDYMPETDHIRLGYGGKNIQTAIHEIAHAATIQRLWHAENIIDSGVKNLRPYQKILVDAFNNLTKVRQAALARLDTKQAHDALDYPLSSNDEFVADLFKHGELMKFLRAMPVQESKGWIRRVWDSVRQFFGAKMPRNAFEQAMEEANKFTSRNSVKATGEARPARLRNKESLADIAADPEKLSESLDERFDKALDKAPERLRKPMGETYYTIKGLAQKGMMGSAFIHDVVSIAVKRGIPAAKDYYNERMKAQVAVNKLSAPLQDIARMASSLKRHELIGEGAQSVNAFLSKMSYASKWAWNPTEVGKPEERTTARELWGTRSFDVDKDMAAAFKRLSPEAQAVAVKMINVGEAMRQELGKVGVDIAPGEGPYLPHKRFGEYLVVAKSKEYLAGNKGAQDEMKSNPNHYWVQGYDTENQARQAARQFQANPSFAGGDVKPTKAEVWFASTHMGDYEKIAKLQRLVRENIDNPKLASAIESSLEMLYKQTLAATSARHAQQRRMNVGGASLDMISAMLSQGHASASLIGSMSHSKQIEGLIETMRSQAGDVSGEASIRTKEALNEILSRHALSMMYRPTPIQNKLMQLTSFQKVLTSPAFFLQQTTEPFIMMLPGLAGHFNNYPGALKAMASAYGQAFKLIGINPIHPGKSADTIIEGLRKASEKSGSRDYEAVKTLMERGRLDLGSLNSMGELMAKADSAVSHGFNKIMGKVNRIATDMEEINRITSTLTAYRMKYAQLMTERGMTAEIAHEKAVEFADEMVVRTHGDYSGWAAPRFMMQSATNVPIKTLMQFRKFQVMELSLMARMWHDAFAKNDGTMTDAEHVAQKAAARRALVYMHAQMGVVAGGLGMPAAGLASSIASLFLRDEDEPWGETTTEKHLRGFIKDENISNLLFHGVPAAMGLDVSGRLGLSQAASVIPYEDVNLSDREALGGMMLRLAGPFFGGVVPQAADAVNLMRMGEYYKGLEQLLPTGLVNGMKAYRFANEGVTNRAGDVLTKSNELNGFDIASQAIGLPSTAFTTRQFRQGEMSDFQDYIKDRMDRVEHRFNKAMKAGDADERASAMEDFKDLQASQRRQGMIPTPMSALFMGPSEQRLREVKTTGGLQWSPKTRGMVQNLENQ